MGTYTTNYNLFLPTIGEQGWGDLVNGNFTTIDNTMSRLNTRIGTLETETNAFDERIAALENGEIEYISGKINISSVSTDSENIKVYTVSCDDESVGIGSTTTTISLSIGSVRRYNASIFNYILSDETILSTMSNTCSVTVGRGGSGLHVSYKCVVTRVSDGVELVNSSQTILGSNRGTWTFTRSFGQTYTVVITRPSNENTTSSVSTSTPPITEYVS